MVKNLCDSRHSLKRNRNGNSYVLFGLGIQAEVRAILQGVLLSDTDWTCVYHSCVVDACKAVSDVDVRPMVEPRLLGKTLRSACVANVLGYHARSCGP